MANERSEAVADLRSAFLDELFDAVTQATYTNYRTDQYSPIDGKVTTIVESQATASTVVNSAWQYEVNNSNVEPYDKGLVVLQDDLAIIPRIGTVVSIDGETYRVIEKQSDPMNIIWELKVRK